MTRPSTQITYDASGMLRGPRGISPADTAALTPRLMRVRREIAQQDPGPLAPGELLPVNCCPDAARLELPERTLDQYVERREASQLGRVLATARRLRDAVDRVVVLGVGGCCRGAHALQKACCEPYFNELSRSQRGGRPRMLFVDQHLDNDAAGGLVELLTAGRSPRRLEDRWALVPIGEVDDTLQTAISSAQLMDALRRFLGAGGSSLADLIVPVVGDRGPLAELAEAIGCRERFAIPAAVGRTFSVFTPAGLLPAAILGLDVVRLLEGASAMSDHFRTAAPGQNAVLDYAGVGIFLEQKRPPGIRVLEVWSGSLEAVGWWYERLLAETAGRPSRGWLPLTAVGPRDRSPHGHPSPQPDNRLTTRVVVDGWRCDPGRIEGRHEHPLRSLEGRTLPELMAAALRDVLEAEREGGPPSAEIRLPRIDEYTLGQLLQMLTLATLVEQRLLEPLTKPPIPHRRTQNVS